MEEDEVVKGHCPECGPDRKSDVRGSHRYRWCDEDSGVTILARYLILECRGCESIYFQIDSKCSEDPEGEIKHWPAPTKRAQPKWLTKIGLINRELHSLLEDTYVALNNDLRVLAAIGVRTAFDLSSELLKVDPTKSFAEKLKELEASGKIGKEESENLASLIDAGSAAAHRGWKPSLQELETMMDTLENFIYRNLILGDAVAELRSRVPQKAQKV